MTQENPQADITVLVSARALLAVLKALDGGPEAATAVLELLLTRSGTKGSQNPFDIVTDQIIHQLEDPRAVYLEVPEILALTACPEALRILADWHEAEATGAAAGGYPTKAHDARRDELRTLADKLEQAL